MLILLPLSFSFTQKGIEFPKFLQTAVVVGLSVAAGHRSSYPRATRLFQSRSSLRRRRKGKNSMVLTSSCSRSICSQALPVVFLSYFVFGSFVCRECVWPVGP
uniref:Uncharacterized protein n=1 Tax=Oryza rufipogon TaxID=4529 RepID=A0A0E0RFD6_ORYRU